ncbi:MAG: ComEC/Rec2 family competence protein, partial [Clostridiales bacterium]|nr:ComEC/Rec2 family competence protein [Clostridiales bacterium]
MIVCSFSCYYSSSFIPSVVLACAVIGLCVFGMKHVSINKPVFLTVSLMFCSVLVYIGLFIGYRLNASCDSHDRYICTVTSVSYDITGEMDLTVKLEGGVLAHANFYCDHESFCPGDSLVIYGNLKKPSSAGNPGEFDYCKTLRKKGVLYVVSCERYEIIDKAGFPLNITGSVQRFFYELRRQSFDAVTAFFDDADKSLAAAVCLGDKSLISSDVKRDFKMSCCSHLLAVSGTHFAGFMACIPTVLNVFKVKRKNAFIVQVLFCLLIGCLTGWSDSVTRAAIMSICLFADREWLSALSLASVIMISADPFCPLSSGFQMSFCAVIAIKVYSGKISEFLIRLHLGEKTASVISVPIAAVLGMIPFWSDISMRPDFEHLLIQIAGSFIAGAACTFFIPCVLLCYLLPFWSRYLSMPLKLCLELLLRIVNIGSSLSEMGGSPVHLNSYLLLILGITVFLFMLPPSVLRRLFLKPAAFVLAVAVGVNAFTLIRKPTCRVVFADVGQGDCCLIITPDKTCLIDAGTYDEGSTTVSDLLDYYGINRVDICVMSHWDVDHAGGIAAL